MIGRRRVLKVLGAVAVAGIGAAAWGFGAEPALRLRVQRYQLSPANWTGGALRIACLADFHLGAPYVDLDRLARIVARANALEADLIVLLGDFAAGHRFVSTPVRIADAAPILARLQAPLGCYSILGNHDWWDDLSAQRRGGGPNLYAEALINAGIPVLSNAAIRLPGFWLAGLEDQLAIHRGAEGITGLDDLPGTLAQVDDDGPVILLAHEPDIFPKVPDRVALTLAGHTHGGQVRLFGWSPIVPSRYGNRYAYGHVSESNRHMVVTGGIGCSILPVRFGMPPEITLIDLS